MLPVDKQKSSQDLDRVRPASRFVFPIVLIFLAGVACSPQYQSGGSLAPEKAEDPYWNDLARFLAGLPLAQGSEFQSLAADAGYAQHRESMDALWAPVEEHHTEMIRPWREKHLPGEANQKPVLYPLSGADFLNVYSFFPYSDRYVMVALEEPGQLPDPRQLSATERVRSFAAMRSVIANISERNYFMSAAMNRYLNGDFSYSGTAPVILIFATRLGFIIHEVDPIRLDGQGRIQVSGAGEPYDGMRISISHPAEGNRLREIVYLKRHLSNALVSEAHPTGKFLRSGGRANVLMKSAVYLLHMRDYTGVRDFVLDQADLIVQDDSGVPYRFLDNDTWDVKLFGTFVGPVRLRGTGHFPQPELVQAFRSEAEPLAFQYGYGTLRGEGLSNLIVATRR